MKHSFFIEVFNKVKSHLLQESDDKFKPTIEWMQTWYIKMNDELFDGALGPCTLTTYTKGHGQNGRVLGYFQMRGGITCNRRTRKMYKTVKDFLGSYNVEIDRDNFVSDAEPLIALNANYSATQDAWLNTLVHEMCHYYTYMNGYAPLQAHGREFKAIAARVASNSNGKITIQRLATAEEMQNFELDASIQQKNAQRKANTISKMMALVVVLDNDQVRLITTTSENLLFEIGDYHNKHKNTKYFGSCKNADLIEFLQSKGYKSNVRKYRFWTITNNKPLLDELLKYSWTNYLGSCDTLVEALGIEKPQQEGLLSRYRIVEDGNGYNILDGQNKWRKTFSKPVDYIRYDKEDDVFYFNMGKFEYTGKPGKWLKLN